MESPRGSNTGPQHRRQGEAEGLATTAGQPAGRPGRPVTDVLVSRAVADQIVARRHLGELHVDIGRSLDLTPLQVIDVYLGRATVVDDAPAAG